MTLPDITLEREAVARYTKAVKEQERTNALVTSTEQVLRELQLLRTAANKELAEAKDALLTLASEAIEPSPHPAPSEAT